MEQALRFKAFPILIAVIALLPSAVLAEQFTPQQMLDVMTKSPDNRDVRVQDMNVDASTHSLFVPPAKEPPYHSH